MKNTYQAPESEMVRLFHEGMILSGSEQKTIGGNNGNSGQNMDAADYSQNPF